MSEWKPDEPALIYKRAMIGARHISKKKKVPNWVLAKELFVVSAIFAYCICAYAEVDPEAYSIEW